MRRIMIFGSAGSGKSTLGSALARILGLPVIHLDAIVWQPGCRTIPDDEFIAAHDELLGREAWIIEGTGPWQTWDDRAAAADTIVLPDYGPWQCWVWVLKRQAVAVLRRRPPQPPDCPMFPMTFKLLRWVWVHQREMRPAIMEMVERERAAGKTILRFRRPAAMRRCLRELAQWSP